MSQSVTLDDVLAAANRISGHIHRTPVLTSSAIDEATGARLFFKCENFQKCGAFKIRGAANAVFSLTDEAALAGVVTASSGNHGAALAKAAGWRNIRATVVMPDNAPAVKKAAVAGYGAEIVYCSPQPADRLAVLRKVMDDTGAHLVHAYDDDRVISGQGTAALELLDQVGPLDMVLAPVGGGGLVSGTAVAVKGLSPDTRVVAVEPAGADDAHRSLTQGRIVPSVSPQTIADGLLTSLGERTYPLIKSLAEGVVLVNEADIVSAMRLIWERMKIVVEPSAAVPLAGILSGALDVRGLRVGLILSGGNVDLGSLPFN